jgi:predicted NBD/HSP70 family sugar kinase
VGCLEAVAGGWALVEQASASGGPVAHIRELVARANAGDASARHLLRDSGRRVGEILAGVINVLNPGAVVIGGDMAAAYDVFVAGLRETLYAGAIALASNDLQIVPATFGSSAGVIGCAQLAIADVLDVDAIDRLLGSLATPDS